jgi:hypothetical protein
MEVGAEVLRMEEEMVEEKMVEEVEGIRVKIEHHLNKFMI